MRHYTQTNWCLKARALAKDSKVIRVTCSEELAKTRMLRWMQTSKKYSAGPKVYDYVKNHR
ncbi:MAG TPA: hypothetical protein VJJ82_00520 [Candidatus Nanoarchaeia archaeon]|nr:hypothetical protein [Candidatus Nanoarchaeia archaeon]